VNRREVFANVSPGGQSVFCMEDKWYLVSNDGYVKVNSAIPVSFEVEKTAYETDIGETSFHERINYTRTSSRAIIRFHVEFNQ